MAALAGNEFDLVETIDPEGQLSLAAWIRADDFNLEHLSNCGAGVRRNAGRGRRRGSTGAPGRAERLLASGAVIPSDQEILRAIVAIGDDGFVPRHEVVLRFRGQGERDMRRAIGRSARRGLALERKDPQGRSFLAVSSEGWEALRSGKFEPRRLRVHED